MTNGCPYLVTTESDDRKFLKIGAIGTCVAEWLVDAGKADYTIDHFLVGSKPDEIHADDRWTNYDAFIVHITLRAIFELVTDCQDPDLFLVKQNVDFANFTDKAKDTLEVTLDRFSKEIRSKNSSAPIFFMSFSEPPASMRGILLENRNNSIYRVTRDLNDTLSELCQKRPSLDVHYLELNDLRMYYGDAGAYDGYRTHFSHAGLDPSPATTSIYTGAIERVVRSFKVLKNKIEPIKLIITDLDNTLWQGVLAEEDKIIPHVHTEGWPLGYVEALLECKRRGILLAISSKNDQERTIENFLFVWGRRLSLNDFCSIKIDWRPKSENIKEILQETNILAQNVLFIDDNPLEIDEVRNGVPGIKTLTGDQSQWKNYLLYAAETQVARVSEESMARTELIKKKIEVDSIKRTMSRDDYLASLMLKVETIQIHGLDHPRFQRAMELVNKTNQFNTTGRRWSVSEFDGLFKDGGQVFAVEVIDRVASHGLVGVAIVRSSCIEQVVLSCRVFGLGVEDALLAHVTAWHFASSQEKIYASWLNTGKNTACETYYSRNGFSDEPGNGKAYADREVSWPSWIGR